MVLPKTSPNYTPTMQGFKSYMPSIYSMKLTINWSDLGVWDPDIRIEPPKVAPPATNRLGGHQPSNGHIEGCDDDNKHEGLDFTGR